MLPGQLKAIPGMVFHEVWETRGAPVAVDNGADPTTGPLMHQAPAQGARIRFVDLPPDTAYLDQAASRMKALFEEVHDEQGLTTQGDPPHRSTASTSRPSPRHSRAAEAAGAKLGSHELVTVDARPTG